MMSSNVSVSVCDCASDKLLYLSVFWQYPSTRFFIRNLSVCTSVHAYFTLYVYLILGVGVDIFELMPAEGYELL